MSMQTKNGERINDPAGKHDNVEIRNIALAVALEQKKDKEKEKTVTIGNKIRPVMGEVISTQLQEGMIIQTQPTVSQETEKNKETEKESKGMYRD